MWNVIRRNRIRSLQVVGLMAALLAGIGALLGRVLIGPGGAAWGMAGAGLVQAALMAITFFGGESVLLFAAGAREISREDAPRLQNIVEEMTIAAGVSPMPRIYVVDSYMQNAFSVGRSADTARIVVTEGLVRGLTRDELQGVIAHEVAHIRNDDTRFMTIASVMLGGITLMADVCRRVLWFGGGRRSWPRGSYQLLLALIGALVFAAALAPVLARLLYLACSREREFLADASAVGYTRYPNGLASALEKIARRKGVTAEDAPRAIAPMFVVNPLESSRTGRIWKTHPPTADRVRILRAMNGAGWGDYAVAFRSVCGEVPDWIEAGWVSPGPLTPCRKPDPDGREQTEIGREVSGVLDRAAGRLQIPCPCGLTIKVPARFPRNSIRCPRCRRPHTVPQPEADLKADGGGWVYERRAEGWEAFRCLCGQVNQLSPALRVDSVLCRKCRRPVRILSRVA